MNPLDIINKLAEQEKAQLQQEFIAPFTGNGRVRLRLCGIVREFPIIFKKRRETPRAGFGIFKIIEDVAVFQKIATLDLVRHYCMILPRARFVLTDQQDDQWFGLQLYAGTRKLQTEGPVPLRMVSERSTHFDSVVAAFDGENFWCFEQDISRPAVIAVRLREELGKLTDPDKVSVPGMLTQELLAYKTAWLARKPRNPYDPDSKLSENERIELALAHAGAILQSVTALNATTATVRFQRGHALHSVTVNRKTLEVVSSGICLSGRDREFDLTSLVSVFDEKEQENDSDPWDD